MIAKNIKNAVDIQKNGKRVLNVIKNGEVVYYYIPDSYVELEYIEGTKNAYINTGIKLDIGYKLHHHLEVTETNPGGGNGGFYGTAASVTSGVSVDDKGYFLYYSGDALTQGIRTYNDTINNNYSAQQYPFYINGYGNISFNSIADWTYNKDKSWLHHFNHRIFNAKNVCIFNAIPVRRLGDAICGLFDTINQKFYPSETQVQFKGGPIKMVDKENIYAQADTVPNYSKNSNYHRSRRSFIVNATNAGNSKNSRYVYPVLEDSKVKTGGYDAEPHLPYTAMTGLNEEYTNFYRHLYGENTVTATYLQNINPNWNILKSPSVTANDYEINNQNLYFSNKSNIEVVLTGNKKGNANNLSISKDNIDKIIHLPYLEYTSKEKRFINIGSFELTADTTVYCSFIPTKDNASYGLAYVFCGIINDSNDKSFGLSYSHSSSQPYRVRFLPGNGNISYIYDSDTSLVGQPMIIRCNYNDGFSFNNDSRKKSSIVWINDTISDLYIGNSASNNLAWSGGKIYYIRFERKNNLYRHYIPAIMILKDGTYHYGFFESVEQIMYEADPTTKMPYEADSKNEDIRTSIFNINGNKESIDWRVEANEYAYGIQWQATVEGTASPTRIGNLEYHKSLPIQSAMKGCIWNRTDGIKYYLDENDWSKKADGTASVLTGEDGDIMVRVPKFYGRCVVDGTNREVWISPYRISSDWIEIPEMVIAAYKGILVDNKWRSIISNAYGNNGKANAKGEAYWTQSAVGQSRTNYSRANMRIACRNNGMELLNYEYYKWILYWLPVIEYNCFNSQANAIVNADGTPLLDTNGYHQGMFGAGITNCSANSWSNFKNGYFSMIPLGFGISDILNKRSVAPVPDTYNNWHKGNTTWIRNITNATLLNNSNSGTNTVFSYRGLFQTFGETWNNLDGIVCRGTGVYTTTDPSKYVNLDAHSGRDYDWVNNGGLIQIGTRLTSNGYGGIHYANNANQNIEIFPSALGGSAIDGIYDSYYQANASNVDYTLLLGGGASGGASAGLVYFSSHQSGAFAAAHVGGRSYQLL